MRNEQRPVTQPMGEQLRAALSAAAQRITQQLDERAGQRFLAMMVNTWTTTMTPSPAGVFVITGDIPAMWLRDSSAQLWPFLRFSALPEVSAVLRGVLRRQWEFIALDPYANAFNSGPTGAHFDSDDLDLDPGVWERKYEIDSLAFPILLAHDFWLITGQTQHLDRLVHTGCQAIVRQWRTEQRHFELSDYRHVRPAEPWDTLGADGSGTPVGYTGMTWSGFRPSDDACRYGYNVPAQLMAIRALRHIGQFAELWADAELAKDAAILAEEIALGVDEYAMVGDRFAYEVDGLGNRLEMDDANMPSLLSLPLISDVDRADPRYVATRSWVLSSANPYYYSGRFAAGVGSPHTPEGYVWHIALAVEGLTGDETTARRCLDQILATDADTGWAHEGFDPDDPTRFTREWFSWANSMVCELMLHIVGGS